MSVTDPELREGAPPGEPPASSPNSSQATPSEPAETPETPATAPGEPLLGALPPEGEVESSAAPEPPVPNMADSPWESAARSVWHVAASPWPALALSGLLALLLALTLFLPQLPGQLDSEAGAADRWLTATAATFGGLGALLRGLGLFQIMQSTLLQLLLGLLVFTLLVQLARLGLAAYMLRQVSAVLDHSGGVNGEPLPLPIWSGTGGLLRWRRAHPAQPLPLANELQRLLDARLRRVERRTARVTPSSLEERPAEGGDHFTLEERLLAVRGQTAALLRPLLTLGMLAAALLIWINAAFGWEYTAEHLAPGERMADAIHDLRFEYRIEQPAAGVLQPQLIANVGSESAVIPVQQVMQERVGGVTVRGQPDAPGLLVQTVSGQLLLARPGQLTPVASIGLGFPSAGSEETLLLPQQAVGLRLVRVETGAAGPAGDSFLVEVFQGGSEQAVLRREISGSEIVTIPTPSGAVALAMTPLPNLALQVRHSPGQWLLWLALGLAALGLPGFWQRPGFVLAQIGPWPPERAVLTVQSDLAGEMDSLKRWYSESTQGGVKE